jgi:hypothetical protein
MTRLGAAILLACAFVVALASPASAHAGQAVQATNYRTEITDVVPDVPGVSVRLIDNGTRIELDAGDHDVVVLGYEGEPYLRIGDDGVSRNRRSPSTYLNESISGGAVPADADSAAEPDWEHIGDGTIARWHDHALHVPPGMTQGLRKSSDWSRPIVVDGETVQIEGRIVVLPGASRLPWLALALVLAVVVVVASRARWELLVVVGLCLAVGADVIRVYGLVMGAPTWLVSRWRAFTDVATLSIVGWGMAVAAIVLLRRRRRLEAAAAAAMAGTVLAFAGGVLELADLASANLASGIADIAVRATVAIALGAGTGVMIATVLELTLPRRRG